MSEDAQKNPPLEEENAQATDAKGTDVKIDGSTVENIVAGAGASINYGMSYEQVIKFYDRIDRQNEAQWKRFERGFALASGSRGHGNAVNVAKAFSAVFGAEQEQVSTENETVAAASSVEGMAELPETPEGLEEWYYDRLINDYERYFVQALAALYGAPFNDVSLATWKLWKLYKATGKDAEAELPPLRRRELLNHISATTRRVNTVDRTFWRNKDIQAQQDFTLRLLHFLADEMALSLSDSRFTDILGQWAETLDGECSRKAAYAIGVVLYYQSADELWRKANNWADSDMAKKRYLAASALNGAYDVDKLENPDKADDTQKSPVFRLLNQWVERAENGRNPRVGSAAAHTYRLMSRKAPDIALAGLGGLLCLPESQSGNDWEGISVGVWVECISNYVGIAWSGRIRQVLEYLARYAKMLTHQQHRPQRVDQREAYDNQRKLNREAILDIFFFTALSSLGSVKERENADYSLTDPLPESPELPDDTGRDIFLMGILSTAEPRWRSNLLVLFCSAIFAEREREVFFFLGQWADIISEFVCEEDEVWESYAQFLVSLGRITQAWETALGTRHLKSRPAYRVFEYQLGLWKNQKSRAELAERVFDTLHI